MAWTLDIQGPNGGAALATDVAFAGARFTWAIDGPGSCEIDLRESDASSLWQPGTHRVIARLDGTAMWAGYLTRLAREGSPGGIQYKASGLGLASVLDYRLVRHAFVEDATPVDQIVEALLDEAQTQYNGDMGFTMGTATGSFPSRTRSYCFGAVIGEAIRELGSTGVGFDWEVDANGALNLWHNSRGTTTAETLADSDTQRFSVEAETSDLLTTVSALGDDAEPWGPKHTMVRSGLATTYGRRESLVEVMSTDLDELADAAEAELTALGGARLRVNAMWIEGRGPWAFGDVWLNDRVSVTLPAWYGGTQSMRCLDVSISLEGNSLGFVEQSFEALVEDITIATDGYSDGVGVAASDASGTGTVTGP